MCLSIAASFLWKRSEGLWENRFGCAIFDANNVHEVFGTGRS